MQKSIQFNGNKPLGANLTKYIKTLVKYKSLEIYIIPTAVVTVRCFLPFSPVQFQNGKSLYGPGSPSYKTEICVSSVADGDQEGEELEKQSIIEQGLRANSN